MSIIRPLQYEKICPLCLKKFFSRRISAIYCNNPPGRCRNQARQYPVEIIQQLINKSAKATIVHETTNNATQTYYKKQGGDDLDILAQISGVNKAELLLAQEAANKIAFERRMLAMLAEEEREKAQPQPQETEIEKLRRENDELKQRLANSPSTNINTNTSTDNLRSNNYELEQIVTPGSIRYHTNDGELIVIDPHSPLYSAGLFVAEEVYISDTWEIYDKQPKEKPPTKTVILKGKDGDELSFEVPCD